MILDHAQIFAPIIDRIWNLSLSTSTWPLLWKRAHVNALPKEDVPKTKTDYRGINVTPVSKRLGHGCTTFLSSLHFIFIYGFKSQFHTKTLSTNIWFIHAIFYWKKTAFHAILRRYLRVTFHQSSQPCLIKLLHVIIDMYRSLNQIMTTPCSLHRSLLLNNLILDLTLYCLTHMVPFLEVEELAKKSKSEKFNKEMLSKPSSCTMNMNHHHA